MNEKRIHQVFEFGILLKGLHALVECISGLALAFVDTGTIGNLVKRLTQKELIEDPHDFVATHLSRVATHLNVNTRHFYAFYLLSHGLVKLIFVAGLLKNKLWAYPLSIAAFALFIVYQLYRFSYTHGIGLIVLTVFDVIVVGLIWHEYRVVRRTGSLGKRQEVDEKKAGCSPPS